MADFYITEVKYVEDRSHIGWVRVRENKPTGPGPTRAVGRAFVADLIRLRKVTFRTATKIGENRWKPGAEVLLFEDVYLTTDKNSTKRDNLGNLPEF